MTEAEWLACTDPQKMLDFVKDIGTRRKLRLFLCAHVRMAWSPIHDFRSRLADVLELLADLLPGSVEALAAMIQEMNEFQRSCIERQDFERAAYFRECFDLLKLARQPDTGMRLDARKFDCPTLHDLFGNPFRPVSANPAWLAWNDGTIPELAQAIYNQRAFDRLPVLADALEVAGCTNADILTHCRSEGPHVRGCWVVDLLLGKA
jgi:hypothetical protein